MGYDGCMFRARRILDREQQKLYLSRWYLMGDGGPSDVPHRGSRGLPALFGLNILLHCIHLSDNAGTFHNHPWKWALSFILRNGYVEHRPGLPPRRVLPFSFNLIRQEDYHWVELCEGKPAWTLFITGPRVTSWGFLRRGNFVPWKIFLRGKTDV